MLASLVATTPADAAPLVWCPECTRDLADWEVHLLRDARCPDCQAELELGLPVSMHVLGD